MPDNLTPDPVKNVPVVFPASDDTTKLYHNNFRLWMVSYLHQLLELEGNKDKKWILLWIKEWILVEKSQKNRQYSAAHTKWRCS